MESIDDLLGPATPLPAQPPKKVRKPRSSKKLDDLIGKRKYVPLKPPKAPEPGGIFALRESKGRNLGRTCLICKTELKSSGRGRPAVICRKKACFRAYRNAYRKDYDKVRS
jgi:hypothetical protein